MIWRLVRYLAGEPNSYYIFQDSLLVYGKAYFKKDEEENNNNKEKGRAQMHAPFSFTLNFQDLNIVIHQ